MAERIAADHAAFDAPDRRALVDLADDAARRRRPASSAAWRTSSTSTSPPSPSDYLAHQDFEERVLMPALRGGLGVEAVLAIHQAIVGEHPARRDGPVARR